MEKNWKFLVPILITLLAFSAFVYFELSEGGRKSELINKEYSSNIYSKENSQLENQNSITVPPENEAYFHFTSVPDLFNWNIYYPQPGWEEAMDWFLGRIENEGEFMLNAGDILDARWWKNKKQVRSKTQKWWGAYNERFEDKNIDLHIAPGDHEYGDDKGLKKMDLTPVYAEQFSKIFEMPENGPELLGVKGLAYSFTRQNLAIISVNTFENSKDHLSVSVSDKQVDWLENRLERYQDKEFIIVQGHVPVFGPVESKDSSAYMLEEGVGSDFWKTMVEHDVDVYLCGEHHRITAQKENGIWQIVHGALWGTQNNVNYLRGSVYPDELKLELFRFPVEYSGVKLENHPHRFWFNRPKERVTIPKDVKENGPNLVGELVIEAAGENNNQTIKSTGEFVKNEINPSLKLPTLSIIIGLIFTVSVILGVWFWRYKKSTN